MVHKLGDKQGHVLPSAQEGTGIYVSKHGGTEGGAPGETSGSATVVPIRVTQPKEKAAIEMQFGDLQIKFNESPDEEQLKVVLAALMGINKPVC